MLDLAPGATRTSRLACQIRLDGALDGLTVQIPAAPLASVEPRTLQIRNTRFRDRPARRDDYASIAPVRGLTFGHEGVSSCPLSPFAAGALAVRNAGRPGACRCAASRMGQVARWSVMAVAAGMSHVIAMTGIAAAIAAIAAAIIGPRGGHRRHYGYMAAPRGYGRSRVVCRIPQLLRASSRRCFPSLIRNRNE